MSDFITATDLFPIDLLADVDAAELGVWAAAAIPQHYSAGDVIVCQGEPVRGMELLLEGSARSVIRDGERHTPVAIQQAPTWMSAISALSDLPSEVTVEALTDCTTALIATPAFRRLALANPRVHQRIMQQVGPIVSRIASAEQQEQRFAALGGMAAGLAHELNNPAAAATRAANQLEASIGAIKNSLPLVFGGATGTGLTGLVEHLLDRPGSHPSKRAIELADAEDRVADAIAALGIANPWEMAAALVRGGVDECWVAEVGTLAGDRAAPVISALANAAGASALACELRDASQRMSHLVDTMKTYTYMDRGAVVDVDVHEGLDATIAMLQHRLVPARISVIRDYAADVSRTRAHGPDLNQAWTNLLNNAIDATGDGGTITVRTCRNDDVIRVEIVDEGPGVPFADRDRVFDWFFTTKHVGEGAGLGLPAARQIIKAHDGDIALESGPGMTIVTTWLPVAG